LHIICESSINVKFFSLNFAENSNKAFSKSKTALNQVHSIFLECKPFALQAKHTETLKANTVPHLMRPVLWYVLYHDC